MYIGLAFLSFVASGAAQDFTLNAGKLATQGALNVNEADFDSCSLECNWGSSWGYYITMGATLAGLAP
jgi:hypothetical protein